MKIDLVTDCIDLKGDFKLYDLISFIHRYYHKDMVMHSKNDKAYEATEIDWSNFTKLENGKGNLYIFKVTDKCINIYYNLEYGVDIALEDHPIQLEQIIASIIAEIDLVSSYKLL